MGAVPPANGGVNRLNELLDQIRAEFESQLRQTEGFEHQGETPSALAIRCFQCSGRQGFGSMGWLGFRRRVAPCTR